MDGWLCHLDVLDRWRRISLCHLDALDWGWCSVRDWRWLVVLHWRLHCVHWRWLMVLHWRLHCVDWRWLCHLDVLDRWRSVRHWCRLMVLHWSLHCVDSWLCHLDVLDRWRRIRGRHSHRRGGLDRMIGILCPCHSVELLNMALKADKHAPLRRRPETNTGRALEALLLR